MIALVRCPVCDGFLPQDPRAQIKHPLRGHNLTLVGNDGARRVCPWPTSTDAGLYRLNLACSMAGTALMRYGLTAQEATARVRRLNEALVMIQTKPGPSRRRRIQRRLHL